MSYQEKESIVSIISTSLVLVFYSVFVFLKYQDGSLNSTNYFKYLGTVILISIVVHVVLRIIVTMVFTIIKKIAAKEKSSNNQQARKALSEYVTKYFLEKGLV